MNGKIDVHHHILPPEYVKAWTEAKGIPQNMKVPEWSVEASLDFMSRNGVDATVLSLSAPAFSFVDDEEEAAGLCRRTNEYAAAIRDSASSKFGFFASLPSGKYIAKCIEEIAYAFDVLGADGVTLLTSYDNRYLGHPHFSPLWEELNRRSAVVFVHPTLDITQGGVMDPVIPRPVLDFPHETTRTAVHMIYANIPRRFPSCKIILSHGGGTLPYIATRVAHLSAEQGWSGKTMEDFLQDAKSMYYDVALTAYEGPLEALLRFAAQDHVLYGSDFPFARESVAAEQVRTLDAPALETELVNSVKRSAALKLFPRLEGLGRTSCS